MVKKIKNNDFSEVTSASIALIDFSATWCGPCKMLAPVLEEVSEELKDKVQFFNADCDENYKLAMDMKVTNIPALQIYKDGIKVAQTVGFMPKEALKNWITEQI